MGKKPEADFSRLNQPMMVTKVFKANGQVFEVSENGALTEVTSSHVDERESENG